MTPTLRPDPIVYSRPIVKTYVKPQLLTIGQDYRSRLQSPQARQETHTGPDIRTSQNGAQGASEPARPTTCRDPRCPSHQPNVPPRFRWNSAAWICWHCGEVLP